MGLSGKFCCCPTPEDCYIDGDNFDRSDNDWPGAKWAENSGDWDIYNNTLVTSDTDAYARFLTPHPDSIAGHFVLVNITFAQKGDKARIVFAGGVYIEIEWGGECPVNDGIPHGAGSVYGCTYLRIFEGSWLLDEKRIKWINGSQVAAGYIQADGVAWATVLPFSSCIRADTDTASSYYVGLATGDTNYGGIAFDDFSFWRAKSATYPECPGPCSEIPEDPVCEFSDPPCYDQKTNLTDDDLYCDWQIISGTWDGYKEVAGLYWDLHLYTEDTNALLVSNAEQITRFGYQKAGMWVQGNPGDKFRIYLDYNGASDCHMAEYTLGDMAAGYGGHIALYEDGVLIDENDMFLPAGTAGLYYWIWLGACIMESEDEAVTGNDMFTAAAWPRPWMGPDPTDPLYLRYYDNDQIHAYITVHANKIWALGTGDTNSAGVAIKPGFGLYVGDKGDTICPGCTGTGDCKYCPDNDGPIHGFSFSISGLTNKYGGSCNCPQFDGTYIVDGEGTCGSEVHATNSVYTCPYGFTAYFYLSVWYEIKPGSTSNTWLLECWIAMYIADPDNYYHWGGRGLSFYVVYEKEFPFSTACRDVVGETLTYNASKSFSYDPMYDVVQCVNQDGLSVSATSW